jgi:hypothetical protein
LFIILVILLCGCVSSADRPGHGYHIVHRTEEMRGAAGPGGLGEGFSSLPAGISGRRFKIAISIEMDEHAHQTLKFRAFTRELPRGKIPAEYYRHLSGILSGEELFAAWS